MGNFLKKTENIFLIFCLFWGLIFMIINPPFQASDETTHMAKIYSFTEGTITFQKQTFANGKQYPGLYLPLNLIDIMEMSVDVAFNPNAKVNISDISKMYQYNLDNKKVFYPHFVSGYTIIPYTPEIIIMAFSKLINLKPLIIMYLLRLTSLLTYLALIYWAIKITPVKKWLFFLCSTLPIAIYQAGAISTDGIVTGLCFLFTAYIFKLAFSKSIKEITSKNLLIIGILLMLITMCKFPYALLLLLYFVIPKEKFKDNKTKFLPFLIIGSLALIYTLSTTALQVYITQGLSSINPKIIPSSRMIQILFTKPLTFIVAIIISLINFWKTWFSGTIAFFGWSRTYIPVPFLLIYLVMLILAGFYCDNSDESVNYKSKTNKTIYLTIFFLFTLITMVICYILFSINTLIISNFQGRYLIPILPLFFLAFASDKKLDIKNFKISTIAIHTILSAVCIYYIIVNFYTF